MSPGKKNSLKNYFGENLQDREMIKKRVCAKIDTHGIKVYHSN